ncbi:hypothetical protein [Nocardia sp. NPDC051981]|uniref:hypothetical protein n=1 Tax=Nocardia sp. NPDC051981 TaxID=3155417 RepID=UPI0034127E7E
MITLTKPARTPGDDEYRTFLGHTYACAACRAGAHCITAVRLGRVWREARR